MITVILIVQYLQNKMSLNLQYLISWEHVVHLWNKSSWRGTCELLSDLQILEQNDV